MRKLNLLNENVVLSWYVVLDFMNIYSGPSVVHCIRCPIDLNNERKKQVATCGFHSFI